MLPPKVNIIGVEVSVTTYDQVVQNVIEAAREKKSLGVTALAVHGVMEGVFSKSFARQLNNLDIVTPDGQPVRWAMNRLHSAGLKERVYGPNLMLRICERAAEERIPIFLYGSKQEVLDPLSENLKTGFPALKIAGIKPDRFRDATPEEDQEDIILINESGAGIVFVGRGCPRQEKWVADHLGKINSPMIAVGAAFDFHAGNVKQAPEYLQNAGLEWLFRLVSEPKRLWKRYLILNPLFLWNLFMQMSGIRKFRVLK